MDCTGLSGTLWQYIYLLFKLLYGHAWIWLDDYLADTLSAKYQDGLNQRLVEASMVLIAAKQGWRSQVFLDRQVCLI